MPAELTHAEGERGKVKSSWDTQSGVRISAAQCVITTLPSQDGVILEITRLRVSLTWQSYFTRVYSENCEVCLCVCVQGRGEAGSFFVQAKSRKNTKASASPNIVYKEVVHGQLYF